MSGEIRRTARHSANRNGSLSLYLVGGVGRDDFHLFMEALIKFTAMVKNLGSGLQHKDLHQSFFEDSEAGIRASDVGQFYHSHLSTVKSKTTP